MMCIIYKHVNICFWLLLPALNILINKNNNYKSAAKSEVLKKTELKTDDKLKAQSSYFKHNYAFNATMSNNAVSKYDIFVLIYFV